MEHFICLQNSCLLVSCFQYLQRAGVVLKLHRLPVKKIRNSVWAEKSAEQVKKQYCHLLNSTLTATERTICCILENYQKEDGVGIPEPLRKHMSGKEFLPFQNNPSIEGKGKKLKACHQKQASRALIWVSQSSITSSSPEPDSNDSPKHQKLS
ncbi:hypothetical protein Peur_029428 [Populus x canadensis]